MPQADGLDGYRGRRIDPEELLQSEVAQFHALADNEVDLEAMREVIRSDELIRELNREGSTIKRLAAFATARLDEAGMVWRNDPDPASVAALDAHRDARAAQLLLNWIQHIIETGAQAEKQLEADSYEQET